MRSRVVLQREPFTHEHVPLAHFATFQLLAHRDPLLAALGLEKLWLEDEELAGEAHFPHEQARPEARVEIFW